MWSRKATDKIAIGDSEPVEQAVNTASSSVIQKHGLGVTQNQSEDKNQVVPSQTPIRQTIKHKTLPHGSERQ